jgi:hypothetical protein
MAAKRKVLVDNSKPVFIVICSHYRNWDLDEEDLDSSGSKNYIIHDEETDDSLIGVFDSPRLTAKESALFLEQFEAEEDGFGPIDGLTVYTAVVGAPAKVRKYLCYLQHWDASKIEKTILEAIAKEVMES